MVDPNSFHILPADIEDEGRIIDKVRCCKRMGYISALTAVPAINKDLGSNMTLPDEVVCTFFDRNAECRKQDCPFFPGADAEVKAAYQPQPEKRWVG